MAEAGMEEGGLGGGDVQGRVGGGGGSFSQERVRGFDEG